MARSSWLGLGPQPQRVLSCPWEGPWSQCLVVVAVATFPRCHSSGFSGPSPQWPHVKSDKEHRERHPLRHRALGSGHHDYALLAEGAALLPWLDVRGARQNEPKHQDLDGNYLSLARVTSPEENPCLLRTLLCSLMCDLSPASDCGRTMAHLDIRMEPRAAC